MVIMTKKGNLDLPLIITEVLHLRYVNPQDKLRKLVCDDYNVHLTTGRVAYRSLAGRVWNTFPIILGNGCLYNGIYTRLLQAH